MTRKNLKKNSSENIWNLHPNSLILLDIALTKKGRPIGAWQVSYSKHSAQDNSKSMASIQNLFTVGKLAYFLYVILKRKCENGLK